MKKYIMSVVFVIMLTLLTACGQKDSISEPAPEGETEKVEEAVQTGGSENGAEAVQTEETTLTGDTAQAAETALADDTSQAAEAAQTGDTVAIANPWSDITEAEARALYPDTFVVPAGAKNVFWSRLDASADPDGTAGPLVQLVFDLDGNSFTAREQRTGSKNTDISGMYYTWTVQEDTELQTGTGSKIPCTMYRYSGEDETADLCAWYDEESGISRSVSVSAEDLDGFDIRAVAEALIARGLPSVEEQRRILEDNRSLWAFDEDDYSPDWYYAFTDLDHNGLLEVLAASTQGSGMFTYAHFYEVLPDGSGIKNLYHADEEVEGIDDWPEVVLESIPCYYDSSSDCYYYVCTNTTRDGMAHVITQLAALSLKDGVAEWEHLASLEILETQLEGRRSFYQDAEGNSITEEDYNSVVEKRFAGMEQSEYRPEWTAVTPSSDRIMHHLPKWLHNVYKTYSLIQSNHHQWRSDYSFLRILRVFHL